MYICQRVLSRLTSSTLYHLPNVHIWMHMVHNPPMNDMNYQNKKWKETAPHEFRNMWANKHGNSIPVSFHKGAMAANGSDVVEIVKDPDSSVEEKTLQVKFSWFGFTLLVSIIQLWLSRFHRKINKNNLQFKVTKKASEGRGAPQLPQPTSMSFWSPHLEVRKMVILCCSLLQKHLRCQGHNFIIIKNTGRDKLSPKPWQP